ncbi:MAG: hypothetical protein RL240_2983 [Planctomycetota bacterium]
MRSGLRADAVAAIEARGLLWVALTRGVLRDDWLGTCIASLTLRVSDVRVAVGHGGSNPKCQRGRGGVIGGNTSLRLLFKSHQDVHLIFTEWNVEKIDLVYQAHKVI